jgi:outer membrane cobalamin receptor
MPDSTSPLSVRALLFAGVALFGLPSGASAALQLEDPAATEQQFSEDDIAYEEEIVVTAPRLSGQLDTSVSAVLELDEEAIASYGVGSIAELLEALEPQTRSGRGRGGRPIMLVNGRRTTGFDGLRNIPPEAIAKVEVFPEEVALQYGFEATERVVNFVLKPDFKQVSAEVKAGVPTAGGRFQSNVEPTLIAISPNGRVNLNAGWDHKGLLTEDERDVIPTSGNPDESYARSLLSSSDTYSVNGTFVRNLDRVTDATLSARFDHTDSLGLLGLSNDGLGNVRRREARTQNFTTSGALNGMVGSWRWSATGNFSISDTLTFTDRDNGVRDRVDSNQKTFGALANMSGAITEGWAGPIRATVTAAYTGLRFDSETNRNGLITSSDLGRDTPSILGSVTIPLLDPEYDIGNVGRLSLTLNAKAENPSDFAALYSLGGSLNWNVTNNLSLIGSYSRDQAAPGVSQLGATVLETDAVTYYDFQQGRTVEITTVTGGNPNLLAETRRDLKFGVNWNVPAVEGLRLAVDYNRNRSDNTANSFPLLTPEIEAAFADRVERDIDGNLIRLDQRPVNFARSENSQIRWGLNFGKSFGRNEAVSAGSGAGQGGAVTPPAPGVRGDGVAPPRQAGEQRVGRGRPICLTADLINNPITNGEVAGAVAAMRAAPDPTAGENARPRLTCPEGSSLRFIPAEGAGEGKPAIEPPTRFRPRDGHPTEGGAMEARPPRENMAQGGGRGGPAAGGMGGGPRGMMGMGRGGQGGGRWQASFYHTIKLTDRVQIRPGVPELDLLNGSATGNGGGTNRHLFELDGGLFYKGFGSRISAKYDSGNTIVGGANGDLKFHDLATFNLRVFADFKQMPNVTNAVPFLNNSRLSLSVNNLFDAQRKVTDASGQVPLNYQPGYIDPLGRYVELSWRKAF